MLRGTEKAAAILSLLGDELSQKILSNLPEDVAISIINASEHLRTPSREELINAVNEFSVDLAKVPAMEESTESTPQGGESAAAQKEAATPLEKIAAAKAESLAAALKDERPEIAAFVLSHMPVERIYEVLTMLGSQREHVESRLLSIKDVPIAKELEERILRNISERLT